MTGSTLYERVDLYDEMHTELEEAPFYSDFVRGAESVLELAAGSGRLTLPLSHAQREGSYTAVDLSRTMLERLRERVPHVAVLLHDMTTYRSAGSFDLVILPFNALNHVLTWSAALRMLTNIKESLRPGGRFVLDFHRPEYDIYVLPSGTLHHEVVGEGTRSWETSSYDRLNQVHHVRSYIQKGDDLPLVFRWAFRAWFPQEFELLVHAAGLRVVTQWTQFPGLKQSHKLIYTLEPRCN